MDKATEAAQKLSEGVKKLRGRHSAGEISTDKYYELEPALCEQRFPEMDADETEAFVEFARKRWCDAHAAGAAELSERGRPMPDNDHEKRKRAARTV